MIAKNYIFGRKYGDGFLSNLVGYYPFNSNANDFSGKGYNGVIAGATSFTSGKEGSAVDFISATGNYINISDNADFSFTNGTNDVPFSIACWVLFNNGYASIENSIINKWSSGAVEWRFFVQRSSNSLCFVKSSAGSSAIYQEVKASPNAFTFNTFHHICYTDNGTGLVGSGKLFINGLLNVTVNQNIGGVYNGMLNTSSIARVGQLGSTLSGNYHHYGKVDELAIWKGRELSASEVLDLYNKGNSGLKII